MECALVDSHAVFACESLATYRTVYRLFVWIVKIIDMLSDVDIVPAAEGAMPALLALQSLADMTNCLALLANLCTPPAATRCKTRLHQHVATNLT